MTTFRTIVLSLAFPLVLLGAGSPVLWKEPTNIPAKDMFYGSGSKSHEPTGPFTFLKEDSGGTNPKVDVRDSQGTKWKVKLGEEAGPETVASRFVWAMGYFTNEDYFLNEIQIEGLPRKLKRGDKLRKDTNKLENVRLKRADKSDKSDAFWKWKENPFLNTREFNGLRTLMAVLNNWDLKDVNNAILTGKEGEQIYLIKDLGASFGTDHLVRSHAVAKGNVKSYDESKFITKNTGQKVDFATPGRPSLVFAVNPHETFSRTSMEWIGNDIPVEDARWMGNLLGQLTPTQIREAFGAGGYTREDCEGFARIVERRIGELKSLSASN